MAELIGIISGVTGIVAFCGQTITGVLAVKRLFRDIKNAPELIQHLNDNLAHIATSRTSIARIQEELGKCNIPNATLGQALKLCSDASDRLRKQIESAVEAFEDGKGIIKQDKKFQWASRRCWESLKVAFERDELMKVLENLSRAQANLESAKMDAVL
jgi:hypothetical protein